MQYDKDLLYNYFIYYSSVVLSLSTRYLFHLL